MFTSNNQSRASTRPSETASVTVIDPLIKRRLHTVVPGDIQRGRDQLLDLCE
jgi:hypothetical protein